MTFSLLQLVAIAGTAMLAAAVLGFVVGVHHGRNELARSLVNARKHLSTLVDAILQTLERAESLCGTLAKFPSGQLSTDQVEKIDRRRSGLFSVLADALQRLTPKPKPAAKEEPETAPAGSLEWAREPVCERTQLPTRSAFEANLGSLYDVSSRTPTSFGVMLVSVDKTDQLRTRFGAEAVDEFTRTTGRLVLHGVRDEDLVCRYSPDTFAVLMPDVDAGDAERIARTVRETILGHTYHVGETGPEVLVTTSLGLALCHPGENVPLVLGRVGQALRHSRRRGRNQLHVHDGQSIDLSASA